LDNTIASACAVIFIAIASTWAFLESAIDSKNHKICRHLHFDSSGVRAQ